jgi:feruloyl esterase
MKITSGFVCALWLAALMPSPRADAGASCRDVAKLALPNATITRAEDDASGGFCRVAATLKPSNDSDIKIEVWLPAAGWNGKLLAVGNGAFTGSIAERAMTQAMARGYATASTDTGHSGGSGSFGLDHPEKVIDFGWRSVHEMTIAAKKIVAARYATPPKHSFWNGCSAGGRQAMKEAQRFPSDFDGIIAGAPGLNWTGRAAQALRVAKTLESNEAARLSKEARERLHRAVLDKCDTLDGVKDGVIENPKRCSFDPAIQGLTPAQVATARLIYASGLQPGSEPGWTDLGWTASARATGLDQFRFLVFADPKWETQSFDFDTDLARAENADADTINALDPDLRPFIDRGGKLIQYHGWSDPQISPVNSTDYYARVVERVGGEKAANTLSDGYRLFMAPGMGHCGGGEGPDRFDMVGALEDWVERGKAPDRIVASRVVDGRVERTRPLCPYPQVAAYKGSGSTDEAVNFVCSTQE